MIYINLNKNVLHFCISDIGSSPWPLNDLTLSQLRGFAVAVLAACGALFLTPHRLCPATEIRTALSFPHPDLRAPCTLRITDHPWWRLCGACPYLKWSEMILIVYLLCFPNLNGLHRWVSVLPTPASRIPRTRYCWRKWMKWIISAIERVKNVHNVV